MLLREVKKVKYLEGYKIRLTFDDGAVKIVDLKNFLKHAKNRLAELKDIAYFRQVKCDGNTIVWPNGVDLCPDVLYEMGKDVASPPKKTRVKRKSISQARKRSKAKNS